MTTELYTPSPAYEVQGEGPYAVPHPYVAGSLTVAVILAGQRIALTEADFTAAPAATDATGDITLTPARAAELDGGILHVRRTTPVQQGWAGMLGQREKGLEVQLDRMTMAVQELQDQMRGALRVDGDIDPFVMQAGRLVIADENGNPAPGPDATDIADAQDNAAAALAAAEAAAAQAAAAASSAAAIGLPSYDDLPALLADTDLTYDPGEHGVIAGNVLLTRADGFAYRVAAPAATDYHLITAGGVRLYAQPSSDGAYNVRAFGAVGDGVADDAPAINAALLGGNRRVFVPAGNYRCEGTLRMYASTHLDLHPAATLLHAALNYCLIVNGEWGNSTYAAGYAGDGNLRISGGTIDMAPKAALSEYCEAIGIAHAENVLIEGVHFASNYNDHFIEINSTRNCTIRNCTFDTTTLATPGTREMINIDYASAPGFPPFGAYDATPCDGVLIEACRFLNGDVAIGSHSAPTGAINRHQNVTVRDCYIDTMLSAGIDNRYWNPENCGVYRTPVLNVTAATEEYRAVVSAIDGRYLVEIPDDGVAAVPMPLTVAAGSPQGMVSISAETNAAAAPRGLYWVRCQPGFEIVQRIATGGLDTAVDLTTGVLTGTTGTDGRVTLSAASDGNLYIENRRGAVLRLTVLPAFGPVGNAAP